MSKTTTTESRITLEEAKERFCSAKRGELRQSTIDTYRYGIEKFVEWCAVEGVTLDGLTTWELENYWLWLRDENEFEDATQEHYMKAVKQFVAYLADMGAVEEHLVESITVPTTSKDARQWDKEISVDRVQDILSVLEREFPAHRNTVIMRLLFHTGMRRGELHAVDVDDVQQREDGAVIVLQNRETTKLKGGEDHARVIGITHEVYDQLKRYTKHHRHEVKDDVGRRPLITTQYGRMSKSAIKSTVYQLTCPQSTGVGECDCDGRQNQDEAVECNRSISPHGLRAACVTHLRDKGWGFEEIGGRVGAQPDTLRLHYDKADKEQEAARRRSLVDEL